MTEIEHNLEAEKFLAYLVHRLKTYKGEDKYISYSDLARAIKYPEPYTGSLFSNRIGHTLGVMGHLFDNFVAPDWQGQIPFIQAMVVSKTTKLPSDGLKEFQPNYPDLPNYKKIEYIKNEYERIFEFGERWYWVLNELDIEPLESLEIKETLKSKVLYNSFGSEGSPEHKKVVNYVFNHPELFGFKKNCEKFKEYPLKSGDSIDVVFIDEKKVLGVEAKSYKSGDDDHERGIFQCIKYREVLKAENIVNHIDKDSDCILVHERDFSKKLIRIKKTLQVEVRQTKVNKI